MPGRLLGYNINAGRAKSQGIELSVGVKPISVLKIDAWFVFNDAKLADPLPENLGSAYGAPGDKLPYSTRLSGNLTVQQDFPLGEKLTGFVGGTVAYVGDREGPFTSASPPLAPPIPPRQDYPAYTRVDLRVGAKYDEWSFTLFGNNIGDRRGLVSGGLGTPQLSFLGIIQPRTVGMTVYRSFD